MKFVANKGITRLILPHVAGYQGFYPAKRSNQIIRDHIFGDFLFDVIDVVDLLELCDCLEEMIDHLEEKSRDGFEIQSGGN